MTYKDLITFLDYNPTTGVIKSKQTGKVVDLVDGYLQVINPVTKQKKKFKPGKLAYTLAFGKDLVKTDRVVHRNLNENDLSAVNLMLVTSEQALEIKEAWKNLQGGIRMQVHPKDIYSYKLFWYENGSMKTKVVQDIVVAKKLERKLLLKYSKILTKYCISED